MDVRADEYDPADPLSSRLEFSKVPSGRAAASVCGRLWRFSADAPDESDAFPSEEHPSSEKTCVASFTDALQVPMDSETAISGPAGDQAAENQREWRDRHDLISC